MTLSENKKQLHHCISAIRNRTSISLNTTSEQTMCRLIQDFNKSQFSRI